MGFNVMVSCTFRVHRSGCGVDYDGGCEYDVKLLVTENRDSAIR